MLLSLIILTTLIFALLSRSRTSLMLRFAKNAGGAARERLLKGLAARTVLGRGRCDGGNRRCRDERVECVEHDTGNHRYCDACVERVSRGGNRRCNCKCRAERNE